MFVEDSHHVARHPGRRHHHIDIRRQRDQAVAHVVAAGPHQRLAGPEAGRNLFVPDQWLGFVGGEDDEKIARLRRFADREGLETIRDGLLAVSIVTIADYDMHSAVAKIEALGAALVTIAEHRHRLAFQRLQRRIPLFEKFHSGLMGDECIPVRE